MRIAKVRTTNFRARGTGRAAVTGLDHLAAAQAADARAADAWVTGYSETALRGIARDLSRDFAHDRKDPLQRWKMARKAAVLRRLSGTRTSTP